MKIENLNLPVPAIEFLTSQGFEELYPPQADSVRAGLLEGESVLVSAPTASGKTLIAMIAMLGYLSRHGGKVVYLSPLRALAAEKFAEFRELQNAGLEREIRVGIDTGDYEGSRRNLDKNDVLVLTNEKMDSIIRRGEDWLDEIGLVISDEVHLIGDGSRGPALEMALTQLKRLDPRPQVVGLSATVTNSEEIAGWLGCRLVSSTWRPVPLAEGVYGDGTVIMNDGRTFEVPHSVRGTPVDLGVQSVFDGGQSLIFASTRVRSKSLATKAADAVSRTLRAEDTGRLARVSGDIMSKNEHTEMVKTLAELVKKGVAFHHAGLNQNCRAIIEDEFRRGTIKLLSSTPTLAAGVNLPARRVVISSISRYDAQAGMNMPISVLEYKQLCGRAGRPQYDEYGESIVIETNTYGDLMEYYVNGKPEPIESSIMDDRSLRIHVLSVIVTNPGITKEDLLEFFLGTLGGQQSRKSSVKFDVNISLRLLASNSMIVHKGGRYAATKLGRRTSLLYIDPVTATAFLDAVRDATRDVHTLGFLCLVTGCGEFYPTFGLRNKDYDQVQALIDGHAEQMLEPLSVHDVSRSLLALHAWISESSELTISDTLGIESGDMHRLVESADRLLYCLGEISKIADKTELLEEINTLRTRVANGIREELVGLVRIKGIGRVRARALYKNKIRTLDDLSGVTAKRLAEVDKIGPVLANKIKYELKRIR